MKILITAGPTREKIDPVRFISNRSTGRMGYALAEAALAAGHEVTLVSGPVAIPAPEGATMVDVVSAADMADAVKRLAPTAQVIIMSAAVADNRPAHPLDSKMKKMPGNLILELERTEDILAALGENKLPGQLLVGFAAETDDLEKNALDKLARKKLDWIAANSVADGFGTLTNTITLFHRSGKKVSLPHGSKIEVAGNMLKEILS